MKKIALVTYNPEMMCFSHVLLYALDFQEKGYDVKLVIEGGGRLNWCRPSRTLMLLLQRSMRKSRTRD